MLTTNGGFSVAPCFLACEESGSCSFNAVCCLNVVVTSRKISSTMSTSISATMMTAGVVRRLRTRKRMSIRIGHLGLDSRLPGFGVGNKLRFRNEPATFRRESARRRFRIETPDKIVAERLHFHGQHFDFFAEITPENQRRNGNKQTYQR